MSVPQLDPFGRPLDTSPPVVMTAEAARTRMAEVRREEAVSADDLCRQMREQQQAEIAALEAEAAGEVDVSDLGE